VAVEAAVVSPIVFFLLMSLIFGAMGVFRYQEMASIARDAARFGSTHGYQFRKDYYAVNGGVYSPGTAGTSATSPLNTSASPYNVAPWNSMLWYQCSTSATTPSITDSWSQYVFNNAVYGHTILLDPSILNVYVGYEPVVDNPNMPDNFPGARIVCCCQYQIFPEAFIWWSPNATYLTVSTSAMPITN
jgi:hypothetical protein